MNKNLFKGKRINNGEWIEGSFLPAQGKSYIVCEAESSCADGENTDLYATEWYEVYPETVCQSTGAADKNGRQMWESDFVKINDEWIGRVIWKDDDTAFCILPNNDEQELHLLGYYANEYDLEVIGNLFDNLEIPRE